MTTIPKNKKILFFCAHPDDDVFSAGALIYTLAKNNNQVVCVYLTSSPRGVAKEVSNEEKIRIRKTEAVNAGKILGVKTVFLDLDKPTLEQNKENTKLIVRLLKEEKPDIIFLPPKNDAHPTHRKVSEIITESQKSVEINENWFYETWTPLEKPNFIFFFDERLMKIKMRAIKRHKSQLERVDYLGAIVSLNTFRGIMGQELLGGFGKSYKNDEKYGEAFLIIKN